MKMPLERNMEGETETELEMSVKDRSATWNAK